MEWIKTDPKLVHILLAGLQSHLDDDNPPINKFTTYPTQYHTVIDAQEAS
jgi:hypothetical protein